MLFSDSIKSVSYLEANTASVIEDVNKNQKTLIITQNGEAKVVVQDIKVYEKMQEAFALLKLLNMTNDKSKATMGIQETFDKCRKTIKNLK